MEGVAGGEVFPSGGACVAERVAFVSPQGAVYEAVSGPGRMSAVPLGGGVEKAFVMVGCPSEKSQDRRGLVPGEASEAVVGS